MLTGDDVGVDDHFDDIKMCRCLEEKDVQEEKTKKEDEVIFDGKPGNEGMAGTGNNRVADN